MDFMTDVTAKELAETLKAMPAQDLQSALKGSALLGFDTETTGLDCKKDAIISAALVLRKSAGGESLKTCDKVAQWLINPGVSINETASKINGFTDEYVKENGAKPQSSLQEIAEIIVAANEKNIPLLAYNASFDVRMLEGDLERYQMTDLAKALRDSLLVVDPLVIDRTVSKRAGRRTLTDTTFYYGVQPRGSFHDATADTIAAIDLVKPMSDLYPQVGQLALKDLMQWQTEAHCAWIESYNRYAEEKGKPKRTDKWLKG